MLNNEIKTKTLNMGKAGSMVTWKHDVNSTEDE